MDGIAGSLRTVLEEIADTCQKAGRPDGSVKLIAVSKTFPSCLIQEAFDAGQVAFGESKWQEASPKIAGLPGSIEWHFIGRIQRNKVRKILDSFHVIHAVDSVKLARYIAEVGREIGISPKIFLQVNVGGEASKGGFEPEAFELGMADLLEIQGLKILGLMTIPPAGPDAEASRKWFSDLRALKELIESRFDTRLPFLSMGMSGDYRVAIEEGATHVRVGSAIFGGRAYRVDGELG